MEIKSVNEAIKQSEKDAVNLIGELENPKNPKNKPQIVPATIFNLQTRIIKIFDKTKTELLDKIIKDITTNYDDGMGVIDQPDASKLNLRDKLKKDAKKILEKQSELEEAKQELIRAEEELEQAKNYNSPPKKL